jgi:guanylate kinase
MKYLIALCGVSGSGKTTLGSYLQTLGVSELISSTTRPIRQGEIPNQTYYYITKEEFDKLDKLENTYYAGNHYCLSRQEVERHEEDLVYCIVDENGVRQIKDSYGSKNVIVININIGIAEMKKRLQARGDSEEEIRKRLKYAYDNDEIKKDASIADYIIRNNDLNRAKQQLEILINKLKKEVDDEKETIL